MKGIFAITAALLLSAGLLAQPADAQRERQQQRPDESRQQQMNPNQRQGRIQMQTQDQSQTPLKLVKAQELLGMEVQNLQDEELGSVEDIVLDKQHQEVSYVVLSSGGFLGIGETYHAVPWSAFQVLPPDEDDDDVDLVLNVSADRMDQDPGFDKSNWPDSADDSFLSASAQPGALYGERHSRMDRDAHAYGQDRQRVDRDRDDRLTQADRRDLKEQQKEQQKEQKQARQTQPAGQDIESRRVSKIIGNEVAMGQREQIGTLEGLVLDLNQGKVAYALVSVDDDAVDVDTGMIALPWTAVQSQGDLLVIQGSPDQLQELAFDKDQGIERLENRAYAARIHDRLGVTPYWQEGEQVAGRTQSGTQQRFGQQGRFGQQPGRPGQPGGEQVQLTGTIERITTLGRGNDQELVLFVRTTQGQQVPVRIGPEWYAREQDVSFREGEQIVITGVMTPHGQPGQPGQPGMGNQPGQNQPILTASVIQTQDQTIELRDQQGRPMWEQGQQARRPRNR